MSLVAVTRPRHIILSLFPGIGLLDMAFEQAGYCVVRGPDKLWGGDIRQFNPPPDVFWGIVAGSPCQDFSKLRRTPPTGNGLAMLREFARCVTEATPEWWLLENVPGVPSVIDESQLDGYATQRFHIDQGWFCDVSRARHIQYGSKSGRLLDPPIGKAVTVRTGAALASDSRTVTELKKLQGLPPDFRLSPFTVRGAKRAIGNGVPLQIGNVLARCVTDAHQREDIRCLCACGCGRTVTGRASYAGAVCRKRAQRNRNKAGV